MVDLDSTRAATTSKGEARRRSIIEAAAAIIR